MMLLLDFGNTRLKWALADSGRQLVQRGVVSYERNAVAAWHRSLTERTMGLVENVRFASVVSQAQESAVLALFDVEIERFVVTQKAGRLCNAYGTPETLGVDRWAAAIGAWQLVGQPCLVIGAGTATTVDVIEADADDGVYRGGLILPGLDLMRASLHQRAARLPQAVGRYRAAPDVADNTHDAITSGAIEATCGAIERMGQRLPVGASWLVSGGCALQLQAVLGDRIRVVDDLVLAGLAV